MPVAVPDVPNSGLPVLAAGGGEGFRLRSRLLEGLGALLELVDERRCGLCLSGAGAAQGHGGERLQGHDGLSDDVDQRGGVGGDDQHVEGNLRGNT
jgi:hypothetical protein